MDLPDPVLLARIQFAFTVSFHILFPAFTIGLASYLAVLEGLWLATRREVYLQTYKFWLSIFAVAFAMGVVSGIVMSYQFGTNWGPFAEKTAPILGPLLAYEVLTAFFLEAGFLGVMLFGLNRVGPRLHFAATLLVAVGTLFSAFWILAANSWMQTPAAYVLEGGRYLPESWLGVIFNPSFGYRFVHMVLAAYLTTAFVVGAVGAWHLLKDRSNKPARVMLGMAVLMAALVAPTQLLVGDMHGLNTQEYQPAKVAAMEGHFETQRGAPLILFGLPDMESAETKYAVGIPKLGSLILKHDPDGEVTGLDAFPREDWPNVPVVFWSLQDHGRHRHADDPVWLDRSRAVFQKTAVRTPLVSPLGGVDGAVGFCGRACGLVRHRSRPSTLPGLWAVAHRRCRLTDRRARCGGLVAGFYPGLPDGIRGGHLLHSPLDGADAGRRRSWSRSGKDRCAAPVRAMRRTQTGFRIGGFDDA